MIWGAFTVFLIDSKVMQAVIAALLAAVLTGFGVIHSASLHWFSFEDPILWGYLIIAAILALKSRFNLEQEDHDDYVEPERSSTD